MQKIIFICDKCGREIEDGFKPSLPFVSMYNKDGSQKDFCKVCFKITMLRILNEYEE